MYFKRKIDVIKSQKNSLTSKGFIISGIYTQKEMHAIISYERSRSDRENSAFSIVHIMADNDLASNRNRIIGFLNNLKKYIRDVDHIGWWDKHTFCVLLPSTDHVGADVCADKIEKRLSALGYGFSVKIYSYPNHWLQSGEEESHDDCTSCQTKQRSLLYEKVFTTRMPIWKRTLDILGSFFGLLILSPLFIITALYIKLVSPGKVFFIQKRVGFRGVEFDFFKFRSMHEGNNQAFHGKHATDFIKDADTPMLKLDEKDPRIIPGGKLLRKLCIDELPQLINVLIGDMSLVGPRPCIPYEKEEYLRWHTHRFDIVPGMTGLWQVSGKNNLTFKQMIRLDIAYCRNVSPIMDIKIILLTFPAIIEMLRESAKKKKSVSHNQPGASIDEVEDPKPVRANA